MNIARLVTLGSLGALGLVYGLVACSGDDDDSNPKTGTDSGVDSGGGICLGADGGPCSTGTGGDSGTGDASTIGNSCTTSTDCSQNGDIQCAFLETAGCPGMGTCMAVNRSAGMCNTISLACACDGTGVNTLCNGLPDGYSTKPIVMPRESTCSDGGFTAIDAGDDDASSSDASDQ